MKLQAQKHCRYSLTKNIIKLSGYECPLTENMCSKLFQAECLKKQMSWNTQVTSFMPMIQNLFTSGLYIA